jgi:DNA mismatch repair protein MutS2
MSQWSTALLEYDALKRLVERYTPSPLGQAEARKIEPSTDRAGLESRHAEVAEAMEYLRAASNPQPTSHTAVVRPRFSDMPDPAESVLKLRIEGAGLDAQEILKLTELLDRASDMRAILQAGRERFPLLGARADQLGDFRAVVRELAGKILPDGTLDDHASLALARLRRDIEKQKQQIHASLERFLRAHHEDGVLREDFVTIRNERFVVPIVTGQQRKIDGVIHGASGSGHTMFVEPLDTIHLNNELVRLDEEEMREVHRILREMTERLRAHAAPIARTIAMLGELEVLFGVAQFGVDFGCVAPRFSPPESRRLELRAARHPLLEDVLRRRRAKVVPISLSLDEAHRTLLISGPNTGGKTVTLKTVGLLALMAQSGLPVPCEQAEFPLFDEVLADIGDNQSIQESLSTFSAHITRVKEMVEAAGGASLVLLDELGRATDPEEGGALGVAILERFASLGAFTLASTHLVALKVYGANTAGVVNGGMGFDEASLQPTYVLRLGAPGKSAGLDIARRLGISAELLERARAAMKSGERDIAAFLAQLHERIGRTQTLEQELEQARAALAERERALAKEWAAKETAKLKELDRRAQVVLDQFEAQARQVIEAIHSGADQRKAAGRAERRVAQAKRELREQLEVNTISTLDEARQGDLATPASMVVEGARVRLKGVREPARVRRKLAKDIIEVDAGFLKLQVPLDDVLEVLPDTPESARLPKNVSYHSSSDLHVLSRELNVIGKRAEEAVEEVDKFLDSAVMGSVSRVRIVHGHGMGVLKRAIAELLTAHPHVEKFHEAPQNEGGGGATIVELKGG